MNYSSIPNIEKKRALIEKAELIDRRYNRKMKFNFVDKLKTKSIEEQEYLWANNRNVSITYIIIDDMDLPYSILNFNKNQLDIFKKQLEYVDGLLHNEIIKIYNIKKLIIFNNERKKNKSPELLWGEKKYLRSY